ncbi:MAG: hypothetical protein AB1499_17925 [Nitrospirota bacterium]
MPSNTNKVSRLERKFYDDILVQLQAGIEAKELGLVLEGLVPLMFELPQHDRRQGIHPSELSGCARRAYYSAIGAESQGSRWVEPKLAVGSIIHELIQRQFRSNEFYQVRSEIPIDDTEFAQKHYLVGHCDLGFYVDNRPVLGMEIKSGTIYIKTPEDHLIQGTVYQKCLEFPYMWYFYVDRNWDKWKCLILSAPDESIIAKIQDKCRMLLSHIIGRIPPKPEFGYFVCNYICNYYYLCKPETKNAA